MTSLAFVPDTGATSWFRRVIVTLLALTLASPFWAISIIPMLTGSRVTDQYFYPLFLVIPVPFMLLLLALRVSPPNLPVKHWTPLHVLRWVVAAVLSGYGAYSPWYLLS